MDRFLDTYVHALWRIGQGDQIRLTDDLTCEWKTWRITVKRGFECDGASIPRLMWRVIGHPYGDYLAAAIVHDAFYASARWPRDTADRIFRDLLESIGIGKLRRGLMYSAVRVGGAAAWKRHTKESTAVADNYLEVQPL